MATKVLVPKLNENADEVTVTAWLRREGQTVEKGEPLVELTTDKAAFELESPATGLVLKIFAKEKSILPTGYVLAVVGHPGESIPDVRAFNERLLAKPRAFPKKAKRALDMAADRRPTNGREPAPSGAGRATPAARRLARERGLDLAVLHRALRVEVVTEEMVRAWKA